MSRGSQDAPGGAGSAGRAKEQVGALKFRLRSFGRVGSTNDVARRLAKEGAAEGTVVVAREQTAGRGRHGREWFSPEGGLYFTVILRPELEASKVGMLRVVSGIAVAEGVGGRTGLDPLLKWPNDLYLGGRKLGGVLIETQVSSEMIALALVGVGLNVQKPQLVLREEPLKMATWLSDHLCETPEPRQLMLPVLKSFSRWYARLLQGELGAIKEAYGRLSALLGKEVKAVEAGQVIIGKCLGIDDEGALIVQTKRRKRARVVSGEIWSWS